MEEVVKKNYRTELFDHQFYFTLAEKERSPKVREVLRELAEGELGHARFWERVASRRGVRLEGLGVKERVKLFLLSKLRRVVGLTVVLKMAEFGEEEDAEKYHALSKNEEFNDTERKELEDIMMQELIHEDLLIQTQLNVDKVRDVIYAVSDGLIEVLAAVSGLAGLFTSPLFVAIGGLIVGISGMISMTIGAYLSSKSEEDIRRSSEKKARLRSSLEGKRLGEGSAEVSRASESVKTTALSYITGAIVPVIPFLLGLGGLFGLLSSYILTGAVTFVVGAMIGLLSDVSPVKKGAVMGGLAIGAALVTHALGLLAHVGGL